MKKFIKREYHIFNKKDILNNIYTANINDKDFLNWLVGFTDGDGSFNFTFNKNTNTFTFSYEIGLHIDDKLLLNNIHKCLNIKELIYEKTEKGKTIPSIARLKVRNQKTILNTTPEAWGL